MRIIMGAILVLLGVDAARAATVAPVMACQQLSESVLTDTVFDIPPAMVDAGTARSGDVAMPAHCLVRGTIEKRVGVGGVPFGSKFELRMPTAWNGRFMFQGGGGTDGAVLPAYGDRNQPTGNGTAWRLGVSGGSRCLRERIVGGLESLSEAGAEGPIIDGAANLEQ